MPYDPMLPASLDLSVASALAPMLQQRIADAEDVQLNGSAVDRISQAALQVLLSAKRSADQAGLGFKIDEPSDDLVAAAKLAGLEMLTASAG